MQDNGASVWVGGIQTFSWADGNTFVTPDQSLFQPGSVWPAGAGVFGIPEQLAIWGTDAELKTIINYCAAHGLKLAMADGMLAVRGNIGVGVEGYGGWLGSAGVAAQRIKSLGGVISYVNMDEPLYYGHQYAGPNAAQDSIASVAQQVAVSVKSILAVFPNAQIGDDEPVPEQDLPAWEQAYQAATGRPLAFVDADLDWGSPTWLTALEQQSAQCQAAGIPLGVYVKGDAGESAADWVQTAESRYAAIAADPKVNAAQIIFATWDGVPTQVGSATTLGTEASLARMTQAVAPLYQSHVIAGPVATPLTEQPILSAPSLAAVTVGRITAISGVHVVLDPSVALNSTIAVVLLDRSGWLSAPAALGARVFGQGTTQIVVSGTLAAVNATLSGLMVAAGSASDQIVGAVFTPQGAAQAAITMAAAPVAPGVSATAATAISAVAVQTLGRLPTSAELASWAKGGTGAAALNTLRATLAATAEAKAALTTLLTSMLGGAPFPQVLSAMVARLEAPGGSLQSVAATVQAAKLDVNKLYEILDGRQADPGAWGFAQLELEGMSSAQLRAALAQSPETKANLSAAYTTAYGAAPSAAALQMLDTQVGTTVTLAQIQSALTAQAVSDVPVIGGLGAATAGVAVRPFSGLILSDPVSTQTETATVTVPGGMSVSGPGLTVSGDEAMVTGSIAAVQATLRGLEIGGTPGAAGPVTLTVANAAGHAAAVGATASFMPFASMPAVLHVSALQPESMVAMTH